VHLEGEGQGVLIWNVSLNRAHSFALTGRESVEMRAQTQALQSPAVTQMMKLRGVSEQKYRATVLPMDSLPEPWTKNPAVRKVVAPPVDSGDSVNK